MISTRKRIRDGEEDTLHDDLLLVGILEGLRTPYGVFALGADRSAPPEPRDVAAHDCVRAGVIHLLQEREEENV